MRFLILSDIHANWDALQAVLRHVRRKRYDRVAFLGDAVGYGASPNAVLNWIHGLGPGAAIVRGNHDRVCSGLDNGDYFNRYAREASAWTLDRLDDRNLQFLRSFPEGPLEIADDSGLRDARGSASHRILINAPPVVRAQLPDRACAGESAAIRARSRASAAAGRRPPTATGADCLRRHFRSIEASR